MRRLWLLVHEPRFITTCMAIAWALVAFIGVAAITAPPTSILGEIGPRLTDIWAFFLILGGASGVVGSIPGWWWVERAGIIASCTGAAIYLAVVMTLHFTSEGSRLVQAGFIGLSIIFMLTRWYRISGAQLDPTRGRTASNGLH